MPDRVDVAVIERDAVIRRGIMSILQSDSRINVRGDAGTKDDGITLLDERSPKVALVGTTLNDAQGAEMASTIRQMFPAIATVVVSSSENDDELFAAIRAGAAAYCGTGVSERDLISIVRRASEGEYVINEQLLGKPYVAAKILDQFRSNTTGENEALANQLAPLTRRELEILAKVSDGMTNSQIGEDLGISVQTVKNHVTSILRKLAVNDRTHAVVTAIKRGWLKLDVNEPTEIV